jgi:hypothetical protein
MQNSQTTRLGMPSFSALIFRHKMDSEEESSIDSEESQDVTAKTRRRAKKPPAKKPPARRKTKQRKGKGPPTDSVRLPDAVKKQFLNDVEEIGSYVNIGTGKPYSLAAIVAQRPELYEPYYDSLSNLIYYFRRRNSSQYRQILDDHQVTPFALRSNLSSQKVQQVQQGFDSEPDPESVLPVETSPRITMNAGGPRVPPGANARAAGRAAGPLATTHTGTLL